MVGVFSTVAFAWALGSFGLLMTYVHGKPNPWLLVGLLIVSCASSVFGFLLGVCGFLVDEDKIAAFFGTLLNFFSVLWWIAFFMFGLAVRFGTLPPPIH